MEVYNSTQCFQFEGGIYMYRRTYTCWIFKQVLLLLMCVGIILADCIIIINTLFTLFLWNDFDIFCAQMCYLKSIAQPWYRYTDILAVLLLYG